MQFTLKQLKQMYWRGVIEGRVYEAMDMKQQKEFIPERDEVCLRRLKLYIAEISAAQPAREPRRRAVRRSEKSE